ncbi:hypothetical protein GGTG_13972, partial [Gaeumannomyces tritici R3-111a-1]
KQKTSTKSLFSARPQGHRRPGAERRLLRKGGARDRGAGGQGRLQAGPVVGPHGREPAPLGRYWRAISEPAQGPGMANSSMCSFSPWRTWERTAGGRSDYLPGRATLRKYVYFFSSSFPDRDSLPGTFSPHPPPSSPFLSLPTGPAATSQLAGRWERNLPTD